MSSLSACLDAMVQDGGEWVVGAPEGWTQGRTLYGGMTAALTLAAVNRQVPALPPLRSAQITFVGPAAGQLRFRPSLLRQGRSSAIIACDCRNEEGHVARSTLVFGAARESAVRHDLLERPTVPAPEACEPFRKTSANPAPGFWHNFETRLAAGARLVQPDAERPEFSVWTRFVDAGPADSTAALLALADCLPPAAMVHFTKPAPISSMTWTLDLAGPAPDPHGWFLLSSASELAADGYSLQTMAVRDEAGAPVALGRQAVAIFA